MRVPATFAALALVLPFVFCARVPAVSSHDRLSLRALARQTDVADVPRVPPEFNINCGGEAVGRFIAEEEEWIVGRTNTFVLEDVVIGGAEEKNLPMYKSHRYGENGAVWGYDIPVMEPGTYGCTVHFAETHTDAFMEGRRVFDLYMASSYGEPVTFKDIDIFKELNGAEFTVLTKTPPTDLVIPGILSIRVNPSVGDGIISGITCVRTGDLPDGVQPDYDTDSTIPTEAVQDTNESAAGANAGGTSITGTEININAGGKAVGRFIAEDYGWIRGKTSFWGGPDGVEIGGAEDKNKDALISHRYGVDGSTWGYIIPIEMSGQYDCSLHFAETDSSKFVVGARVFNIMLQDQTQEDVDAYRESGEAPFTSVVKTFFNVSVGNELFIALTPVRGDAFLSAVTCERIGELIGSVPTSTVSSPEAGFGESPIPEESASEALEPAPTSTPVPAAPTAIVTVPVSQTPVPPTPVVEPPVGASPDTETPSAEVLPVDSTPVASEDPTSGGPAPILPSPSPVASDGTPPGSNPTQSVPVPEFPVDEPLTPGDGEVDKIYDLLGRVSGGGNFTEGMKDALIEASKKADDKALNWAMTDIEEEIIMSVSRTDTRSFRMDLQAIYKEDEEDDGIRQFKSFIEDGDVNNVLRSSGIQNLEVSFRTAPVLASSGGALETASTSAMSTLVGAIIGGVLGLLAIVALVVFFVVRRNRDNEPNAAGFEGPPPAMSESEMSSVMERSETAASVEYLDDDSTFTAATSRAGEHVDQVAFDKDVFGRGTAAGAHGSS